MNTNTLPFVHIEHIHDVILYAHQQFASDIHFEPKDGDYQIRLRINGLLKNIYIGPIHHAQRLTTQLKVMAQLDIAEQRLPQDGRIAFNLSTHTLDIRVSSCPTLYGEKIVLRLLDPKAHIRNFVQLGLNHEQSTLLTHALAKPHGLILVTGPTGSGKTTTLYSALNTLNHTTHNIATVEDPVEITLPGINQVPVQAKINLSFARILRSLLRQDPDIIMIGEIRDQETAQIAIQAAQTGHLVLSTLHTSNALEAVTRLENMGISRYELLSTLHLIIAQRLLRTQTSRIGIYECLPITALVKKYILAHQELSYVELQKYESLTTLHEAALDKVSQNLVTLEEVNRVVPYE
ncbi:MAG: GspE/PulE family protein [Legionellales bacterium]|jgi:type IV pilus assembly protein PilB